MIVLILVSFNFCTYPQFFRDGFEQRERGFQNSVDRREGGTKISSQGRASSSGFSTAFHRRGFGGSDVRNVFV